MFYCVENSAYEFITKPFRGTVIVWDAKQYCVVHVHRNSFWSTATGSVVRSKRNGGFEWDKFLAFLILPRPGFYDGISSSLASIPFHPPADFNNDTVFASFLSLARSFPHPEKLLFAYNLLAEMVRRHTSSVYRFLCRRPLFIIILP